MSMLSLAPKLPLYWAFRRFGWPRMYPFSVVVSISFRCNSKCRTCDVWRKPNDDMTVAEWDKVFANLGRTPFYITFTGGEPFLRKDLDEMVISAYRHCRPSVITIPTNGLLTDRIVERVDRICRECPTSQIGINLSLDGIGEEHDDIRGRAGQLGEVDGHLDEAEGAPEITAQPGADRSYRRQPLQPTPLPGNLQRPAVPRTRFLHHRGGGGTGRAGHRRLGHHARPGRVRADRRFPERAGARPGPPRGSPNSRRRSGRTTTSLPGACSTSGRR